MAPPILFLSLLVATPGRESAAAEAPPSRALERWRKLRTPAAGLASPWTSGAEARRPTR